MEFRETTQADIEFVGNHSVSRGFFHKRPEITEYSYTLEHEGRVLGIGGMNLITPTVAWLWVDLTCYAGEHMKTCYRVISEWMSKLTEDHGIKRLQAYIDLSFPEAIRMAQHLGFTKESEMQKFIGENPAGLYVKFVEVF